MALTDTFVRQMERSGNAADDKPPGVRIVVVSSDEVERIGDGQGGSCDAVFSRTEKSVPATDDAVTKQADVGTGPRERHHGANHTWPRQFRDQGTAVPGSGKNAEKWTSEDRFAVVLETAALNAAELMEYCRREGLFAAQTAIRRAACMSANASAPRPARGQQTQAKEDRKRIRQPEKELHRKEKALAEAATLPILRKETRRSGGDQEED